MDSMIKRVRYRRFKQFQSQTVDLKPQGISLLAGGNNSGKSTLLHGLAVWEFCRTALEMERGRPAFNRDSHMQGLGLGDDEFSPIAVPSLKHLWTNLKTQRTPEDSDGYTLRIACDWTAEDDSDKTLEFGLALANDRLFIKVTGSNLDNSDRLPILAYLPPFAGITDHEMRLPQAIRRRRIGEGLAGAVLRNLLLDMEEANSAARLELRGSRSKISDADLRRLRASDPWEVLQDTLRTRFSAELIVDPFREEYHSYIRVEIVKGEKQGYLLKRFPGYSKRDLMVEGSGFLQWLSVYALAVSPAVDTLLLDEPDAHLHPTLQSQLLESLSAMAARAKKQMLVATHSTELLRHAPVDRVLEVRSKGSPRVRYLSLDHQKVGLLAGLGSDYAPRLDPIRKRKRVLFIEGETDCAVLKNVAKSLRQDFPGEWPVWITSRAHKERRQLFLALEEDIPGLRAISLRDRDDENSSTTSPQLDDLATPGTPTFVTLKWRRRDIESYLLLPEAIARVTGQDPDVLRSRLANDFGLAIGESFQVTDCPQALLDAHGKSILSQSDKALLAGTGKGPGDIAAAVRVDEICEDLRKFFTRLQGSLSDATA